MLLQVYLGELSYPVLLGSILLSKRDTGILSCNCYNLGGCKCLLQSKQHLWQNTHRFHEPQLKDDFKNAVNAYIKMISTRDTIIVSTLLRSIFGQSQRWGKAYKLSSPSKIVISHY